MSWRFFAWPVPLAAAILLLTSAATAGSHVRVRIAHAREGYQATITSSSPHQVRFKHSSFGGDLVFKDLPAGSYLLRVELDCGAALDRAVQIPDTTRKPGTQTVEIDAREARFPGDWDGGAHTISVHQLSRTKAADRQFLEAWQRMEANDTTGARCALRKVLKHDPGCKDAWTNLGIIAEWEGQLEEAERHHRQALRIDPGGFSTNINLSEVLEKRNNLFEATEFGLRAFSRRPGDLGVNLHLGALFGRSGKWAEAIRHLETARTLQADSLGELQIFLVVAYVETGSPAMALKEAEDWLQRNPRHERYLLLQGVRDELRASLRQ